ncbi:MAG: HAD family hydrolase [Clostridia bacterium]|nr:HAD family hydrolase [Clostridia bacterium]
MSTKMVLFDLDGTLLPMEQKVFVKTYLGMLARRLAPHGYDPEELARAIWTGTEAMVANDGGKRNEEVFWDKFAGIFGEEARADEPLFERFYIEEFDNVQPSCGYNPKAAEAVEQIKTMGYRVALATNPLFPSIATEKRIRWAGLTPDTFELFTSYENSRYCKPNPEYYKDVIASLGVSAEECLMVGNDVGEDMIAERLGMKVFLLTDCMINKNGEDISKYPHGSFDELLTFVREQL